MANLKDGGYCACRRCYVPQGLNANNKVEFKDNFDGAGKLIDAPPKIIELLTKRLKHWKSAQTNVAYAEISNKIGMCHLITFKGEEKFTNSEVALNGTIANG
jgi:hypothetical protein